MLAQHRGDPVRVRAKRAFVHLREVAAGPVVRAITINRPPEDVFYVWHHAFDHPLRFRWR